MSTSIEQRRPEKSEMFNHRDARAYLGCDDPKTSDYVIVAEEIARRFGKRGHLTGNVAEVCFGPGNLSGELLQKGADKVIGIDGDPVMVTHAKHKFAKEISTGQMEFRKGLAQQLPIPDRSVRGIINFNSFHQFGDGQRAFDALDEMVRVIEPDGWGHVRDFRRNVSPDELNRFLRERTAKNPAIQQLLDDSIHAAFTTDEFMDMLKLIPGIRFSVGKTKDPRRLSQSVRNAIDKDPVAHWMDHWISQEIAIQKLK